MNEYTTNLLRMAVKRGEGHTLFTFRSMLSAALEADHYTAAVVVACCRDWTELAEFARGLLSEQA